MFVPFEERQFQVVDYWGYHKLRRKWYRCPTQECINLPGSSTCACNGGYILEADGQSCTEIDECALGLDNCSDWATCANTDGAFTCTCNEGFGVDGITCFDLDECTINNGGCEQICINTLGTSECACNAGFTLDTDGSGCTDVDECS